MIASLYAGISGISTNAIVMTVVGDNIANLNTTAYKSNRPEFANVLSSSMGGNTATGSGGRGVEFWAANAQSSYGSLESPSAARTWQLTAKRLLSSRVKVVPIITYARVILLSTEKDIG